VSSQILGICIYFRSRPQHCMTLRRTHAVIIPQATLSEQLYMCVQHESLIVLTALWKTPTIAHRRKANLWVNCVGVTAFGVAPTGGTGQQWRVVAHERIQRKKSSDKDHGTARWYQTDAEKTRSRVNNIRHHDTFKGVSLSLSLSLLSLWSQCHEQVLSSSVCKNGYRFMTHCIS